MNAPAQLAAQLGGYWAFLVYALTHLGVLRIAPVRAVFERQLYFTGIQGASLVALLGLLAGALTVTQATALLGGSSEITVRVLVWTVVGELGPLRMQNVLFRMSQTPGSIRWAGRRHGADTDAVLKELGRDEDEIVRLREAGVV